MEKQNCGMESKEAKTKMTEYATGLVIKKEVMEICVSLGEVLLLCIENRCLTRAETEIVKRLIPPVLDLRAEFSADLETTISHCRESFSHRNPEA